MSNWKIEKGGVEKTIEKIGYTTFMLSLFTLILFSTKYVENNTNDKLKTKAINFSLIFLSVGIILQNITLITGNFETTNEQQTN